MSIKMGYQLSSVTKYLDTPEHLHDTFLKLAEIGYCNVQLQGVPLEMNDHLIAKALTDAGLNCVATQEDYPFGFGENPERAIARAVRCAAQYISCALIPRDVDTPDALKQFSEKFYVIAEKVRLAGLTFAFHPIGWDFRFMDGQPVFERLLDLLPESVQLTFCVNAAFSAGVNPELALAKYAGRVDLVHFKDSIPTADGNTQLVPLGQGMHDWAPVLQACHKAGVAYVFAEQERWQKDAFECAKDSFEYLLGLGL